MASKKKPSPPIQWADSSHPITALKPNSTIDWRDGVNIDFVVEYQGTWWWSDCKQIHSFKPLRCNPQVIFDRSYPDRLIDTGLSGHLDEGAEFQILISEDRTYHCKINKKFLANALRRDVGFAEDLDGIPEVEYFGSGPSSPVCAVVQGVRISYFSPMRTTEENHKLILKRLKEMSDGK